ncbi:RadC family protein [Tannockella kyphosi]|uniref:RadC family protein n=1 Tax=Tannockella kyphosi TaxID=2899121 RepID=UPI002012DB6A|nr:DNA repair protein RadC [Tannockella kyphosi]
MKLKEYPVSELPREKALEQGIQSLSNVELLSLLLRTGSKEESVLELSQRVINQAGGLSELPSISYHSLIQIKGIKKAKAITLLASVELAKRLLKSSEPKVTLNHPTKIYQYIINELLFEKQEKVYLLCLNVRLEVIQSKLLFIGSNDVSIMATNEIFQNILLCGAKRFVLVHNHPSGNPYPSKEDIITTKKIKEMAKSLEITLVDHIIIGDNKFYSFEANQVFMNED